MSNAADYYLDGYMMGQLKGHEKLREQLTELVIKPPRSTHRWEQKYPGTLDLRPAAHSYHPSVIDTLYTSGIPEIVEDVIGADMVMFHVQIRRSFKGPSYMDWHRDTYRYGTRRVGNFPPVHKVIFYPSLGRPPEPKLKMRVGSQRLVHETELDDQEAVRQLDIVHYESSDDQYVLFDTSMMHGAVDDTSLIGSIRIIYSFIRRTQYEAELASQALHREQVELYDAGRPR